MRNLSDASWGALGFAILVVLIAVATEVFGA